MLKLKFSCLATISLLMGCVTTEQQVSQLMDMTVEDARSTLTVKGIADPLELKVEVSSYSTFQEKRGLLGVVLDDVFLRGYVDKRTGTASYQVYTIQYSSDWAYPYQANYSNPAKSAEMTRVSSDVDCSTSGCTHVEHSIFNIDQTEMDRVLTATPEQRATLAWKFKIKNKQMPDWDYAMMLPEIIAFAEEMAAVRAQFPSTQ